MSANALQFTVRVNNEAAAAMKAIQVDLAAVEGRAGVASKVFGGLHGSLLKAGAAMGDMAKIAGGFVIGQGLLKAPGALMSLSSNARDLELQMKKATTVFGDQLPVVQKWADGSAAAMGLSKKQAVNLASGLQDLLVPMGFTREAATKMTTETLNLAGALAEWSGGQKGAAEVSDILTKAYLGETDGLKALGIAISADEVNSRLAAAGKDKLKGAALEQAKALEIQKLVMEKSTDAQKAFADGAGSAARKQAEMSARIAEAKEKLAVGLAPVFVGVTTLLATALVPALDVAMKGFSAVSTVVGDFSRYMKYVNEDGDTLNDWLSHLPGFLQPVAELAGVAFVGLKDVAGVAWDAMRDAWAIIQPLLEKAASYTWEALQELAKVSWDAMKDAWQSMSDAFAKVPWGKAKAEASDTSNWAAAWGKVTEKLRIASDVLRPFAEDLLKSLKGNFEDSAEALRHLGEALRPLEPLLKPLATILGVTLVVAAAATLKAVELLHDFFTLQFVLAIEGAALMITGLVRAFDAAKWAIDNVAMPALRAISDFLTGTVIPGVQKLIDKVLDAKDWIGHYLNIAGGYFTDFWNLAKEPLQWVMNKVQDLIDLIGKIPSPGGIIGGLGGALDKLPGVGGGGGGGLSSQKSNMLALPDSLVSQYIGGGQMGFGPNYSWTKDAEGRDTYNGPTVGTTVGSGSTQITYLGNGQWGQGSPAANGITINVTVQGDGDETKIRRVIENVLVEHVTIGAQQHGVVVN